MDQNEDIANVDWDNACAPRARGLRSSEIRELLKLLGRPGIISFAGGIPDPNLFPRRQFAEAYARILSDDRLGSQALQYAPSEGHGGLRTWIAGHMGRLGVPCDEDNILITAGSQQGLDLIGRTLISEGDTVLVTDPTYLGALQAFAPQQPLYAVMSPSAELGKVDPVPETGRRVALAYAVADFANPTGATLSTEERLGLLDLCEAHSAPLVEDAAYEAIRFTGGRVASCLALDVERNGSIEATRTLYCGTFSKTLSPGLRVGWICAARDVVRRLVLSKQAADLHTATINQMAVLDVAERSFDEQVERVSRTYARRRDALLSALERVMPTGLSWTKPEGGMFVWLTLPPALDAADLLVDALREEDVAFVPGRAFSPTGDGGNTLRLNYTLHPEGELVEGIERLGRLIGSRLLRRDRTPTAA